MKTYYSERSNEKRIHVRCNLCGSDDMKEVFTIEGSNFVQCRKCGLVYQNPQPVFSDLQRRYGKNYFEYEIENERNFFRLMLLGLKDINFEKLESGILNTSMGGARFMDIGCATGMLLSHMKSRGWITKGVELCRESAEYGIRERGLDIHIGPVENSGTESDSFSVIHFSHLIEHVPDPMALLKEVHRILVPNGYAIVTTPNFHGFQAKLLKKNWRSAIPDHLFLFTPATLREMLKKTGFEIEKFITWGGIAKGLAPYFIKAPMDRLAKLLGFGDVMLFLARKD